MKPILILDDVLKRFPGCAAPAVDHVSLNVMPGEVLALLGPSGCGKTTTLRLIAGFERLDGGRVELEGRVLSDRKTHVAPQARKIGFVFQDYALFPHLDVLQNVLFGLRSWKRSERLSRAKQMLEMLELGQVAHRRPHQLSGGQQQRVALARSMAPAPKLILLDEPFSNLDARLRQSARGQVRQLLKDHGMSAVLVTHDREEAMEMADRIAVMAGGEIEQLGPPQEIYYHPRTCHVAQFLGRTNLLMVEADGQAAQSTLGTLKLDRAAQGRVRVSLRPEALQIQTIACGVTGKCPIASDAAATSQSGIQEQGCNADESEHHAIATVTGRQFCGGLTVFRLQLGEQPLIVQCSGRCEIEVGSKVRVAVCEPATVVDRSRHCVS